MRKLREKNINTPEYFDKQFSEKDIETENVLRQEKYMKLIGDRRGRVIELGCGMSYFPVMATVLGESWGLDFTPKTIKFLKKRFPNVNYVLGNAMMTAFKDDFFDIVVSGELLEHLEVPGALIAEMNRICKPGGVMILSTPHLEFDDPEHLWEFEESDLKELFGEFGSVKVETVESDIFKGRKYLFAVCEKHSSRG